jgi:hypothetical protein
VNRQPNRSRPSGRRPPYPAGTGRSRPLITAPGLIETRRDLALLHFTPVSDATRVITIGNDGTTTGDAVDKPLVVMQHLGSGGETCRAIEVP